MELDRAQLIDLAHRIIPGFGAFGPDRTTCLSISVDAVIDQVVLSIAAPSPGYLNLRAPVFYDKLGRELPADVIYSSVALSSFYKESTPNDILSMAAGGALLHSGRELCPTMIVKLKYPVFVSCIEIYNRGDIYHRRSRYLTVRAFDGDVCRLSYDTADPNRLIDALFGLTRQLSIMMPEDQEAFDVPDLARTIRAKIRVAAENGYLRLPYRQLCTLLPMFGELREPDDYEKSICSYMVVAHLGEKEWCGTRDLRVIAQFLHSDSIIEDIRTRANAAINRKFGRQRTITFSKHHIHYSRLVERRDDHLRGLDKVFSLFNDLGIPLMLCYGTLLGAVREEAFIEHDDDVDLLYFDGSKSQDEMRENQVKLAERISAAGFRVDKDLKGKNFHIYSGGISIDLFPSWLDGDRLNLLMQQMRFRDIDASLMLGENYVSLHGRTYPSPVNTSGFLEERYGETWRIPNIYYGWPWKVSVTSA